MRRSVRLYDRSRCVTLTWGLGGDVQDRPFDESEVRAHLGPFLAGENVPLLRAFLEDDVAASASHSLRDEELVERVVRLVARGLLVAERAEAAVLWGVDGEGEDEAPIGEEAPRAKEEPKTWIEIEMIDMADQPVPNLRYVIELPDGSERTGMLDQRGRARVDGIDPGECKVRFPDFDQDAWENA